MRLILIACVVIMVGTPNSSFLIPYPGALMGNIFNGLLGPLKLLSSWPAAIGSYKTHWIHRYFTYSFDKIDAVSDAVKSFFNIKLNEAMNVDHEDAQLNIVELIVKYNHIVEKHKVHTDDGYILTIFRIPPQEKGAPVVFLMHGLLGSADDWVLQGPQRSLAYLLHESGYDVWMGNARGNKYSREHVSIQPELSTFWEFSWHEIGLHDLPATIDYILEKVGQRRLFYVGHGQGTTCFLVMCSTRPEYNLKIVKMFALSPVALTANVVSPLVRMLAPFSNVFKNVLSDVGQGEFLPNNNILQAAGGFLCRVKAITNLICSNIMFIVCGFNAAQLNPELVPVFLGHYPAGCSTRQLLHYGQGVVSRDFRSFDYGHSVNLKVYGRAIPPSYDLKQVTAPMALYYSDNDWLSHPTDVMALIRRLSNVADVYRVADRKYNHLDYILAKNAREVIYDRLIYSIQNDL